MRLFWIALATCPLPACLVTPGGQASIDLGLDAATQYNHRGMPQNEHGVLQPSAAIHLPAISDGLLSLATWANMDLTDDTGDAWMPDDNAWRFSEIDYIATYAKRIGAIDARFGIHNYNLPLGREIVFAERGATVELFAHGEYELAGKWFPFAELRVDIDEAQGWYAIFGCAKSIPIDERFTFEAEGYCSYTDEKQADWSYTAKEAGFADARLTTKLFYQLDASTRLNVLAAFSTMVDDEIRDEFDANGIDTENAWISGGLSWSY